MNQPFWAQNIKIYHKNNKKSQFRKSSSLHEAICQPTTKSAPVKLPRSAVAASWMASFKQDDLLKWHFLLVLWYILIFWAQKCWFIELDLSLSSGLMCRGNKSSVVETQAGGGGTKILCLFFSHKQSLTFLRPIQRHYSLCTMYDFHNSTDPLIFWTEKWDY